jgi:putative flippase GtrA
MSRKTARQFARFSVVGTSTFLIDYGLLMFLSLVVGMDPVPAGAISFIVSLVINYLASMKFVFTRREDISRRRQFGLFVLLSIVALILNEIIIWLGMMRVPNTPLNLTIVKVLATMMVTLWNFFSRMRWLDAEGRQQMKGQSASLRKAMRVRWLKWRKRRRG